MTTRIKFLRSSERKKLLAELQNTYGITNIPKLLIKSYKEKTTAFSGNLNKDELSQLKELTNIETIGANLTTKENNNLILNFDFVTTFKDQINKNIIEINKEQFELWIHGYDLEIPNIKEGVVTLKYNNDLVGIGKSNTTKIFNYIPKGRKLKTPLK